VSELLKQIDQMTSIAGENRLELLTFCLDGPQLYAVNVFKVREVMPLPDFVPVPESDPFILGLTDIRGQIVSLIDLPQALDLRPIAPEEYDRALMLLMEFNRRTYGMVIRGVHRIYHLGWNQVTPPPEVLRDSHYLTAQVRHEGEIIHLLDLEKVMADILGLEDTATEEVIDSARSVIGTNLHSDFILVAEDSPSARKVLQRLFDQLGLNYKMVHNGAEALALLEKWAQRHREDPTVEPVWKRVLMLVTDLEMPVMDGYTLIRKIREHSELHKLFVVVNSSMSGEFNEVLTDKVGADAFLVKGQLDEMTDLIRQRVEKLNVETESEQTG